MTEPFARLRRFLRELKRRNVYKVAVTYLAVAFVGFQAARLLIPATVLPGWADEFFLFFLIIGFPVAVVVAWAFEMSPEGMRRTETPEGEEAVGANYQWIGLALVVVLAGGVWYVTAGEGGEAATDTAASGQDTVQAEQRVSSRSASRDRPFVAVLPLENLSPSEENAFFAAGVHEEILNQLSKVSGLGVFARTTMSQYADTEKSVYEIGRELDAQAVLEGSVRRADGRVRISAQLIDPQSRDHLWSETYERELSPDAVFDIQAEIGERIAGALEAQLTGNERRRIEDVPTDNLAAYDAYLEGRNHLLEYLGTREAGLLTRAINRLEDAIDRDPAFAEPHAWLGRAYVYRVFVRDESQWFDSATAMIDRAQDLNPDLAEVYVARGFVSGFRGSPSAKIDAMRRALELQASHALAKAELSDALLTQGRYTEAVQAAREAVQLDPRNPHVLQEMADQVRTVGFYEAAEAWDSRALEIEPGYYGSISGLAISQLAQARPGDALETWQSRMEDMDVPTPHTLYSAAMAALQAGQPEQAKAYLEQIPDARRQRPETESSSEMSLFGPSGRAHLGLAELRLGNRERGRELLRQAADSFRVELADQETSADTTLGFFRNQIKLAGVLAALGQTEEALTQLEESGTAVLRTAGMRLYDPFFDDLRSDPRFQKIVREVEARRKKIREEVRQLGIDLYPPGAEPDSARRAGGASE